MWIWEREVENGKKGRGNGKSRTGGYKRGERGKGVEKVGAWNMRNGREERKVGYKREENEQKMQ